MSLLAAHSITFSYSHGTPLFSGVSFQINPGDRIGLVGPNGCGKTTMLRLMADRLAPSGGEIAARTNLRRSHLEQEPDEDSLRLTAVENVLALDPDLPRLRRSLHVMETQLERQDASMRYAELTCEYQERGGFDLEAAAERVLDALGFAGAARERPLAILSGGERVRAGLAQCLLSQADLLLLDEPTNHLDAAAREWLESYLGALDAAVVVVSHDRVFLNRVTTRTLALDRGRLADFAGNYDFYLHQHELARRRQLADFGACERRRAAAEEASRRRLQLSLRVATPPPGVRSSRDFYARKAAKVARTSRILKERQLHEEKVDKPWEQPSIPVLTFSNVPASSEFMLRAARLTKRFGETELFRDLSFHLRRGDRLAISGPNGSGKTTLLRILNGTVASDAGRLEFGARVKAGYYAQSGENLPASSTALGVCGEHTRDETAMRTLLGCLRLDAGRVLRALGSLSAGERSKVALARLLLSPVNLLLLDEPTNHLEIEAIEAVEHTLKQFPGAIVIVSHERSLVDSLATAVIELGGLTCR